MTAGLPCCLLAFHRLVDQPTPGRAAVLGLAITAQTALCAYYGIMMALTIGYAVLFTALAARRWRDRAFWMPIGVAAAVAIVTTMPFAMPYVRLQSETGFNRSLEAARGYSANWRMYFASSSFIHAPMMRLVGRWNELLFPGIVPVVFGAVGLSTGWRADERTRRTALLYASLAVLAVWVSLGPGAGLYRLLYDVVPGFTFMRAPSRFGVLVPLALVVLAGIGVASVLRRNPGRSWLAPLLIVAVIVELAVPLRLTSVPPAEAVYRDLAARPRGAVLDLPVYSHQFRFLRTQYMLGSTIHWMPIVVSYSDFIPPEFQDRMNALADFPSRPAFAQIERDRVRYVVFHLSEYRSPDASAALQARLTEFATSLRRLYGDDQALLYEVIGSPSDR